MPSLDIERPEMAELYEFPVSSDVHMTPSPASQVVDASGGYVVDAAGHEVIV